MLPVRLAARLRGHPFLYPSAVAVYKIAEHWALSWIQHKLEPQANRAVGLLVEYLPIVTWLIAAFGLVWVASAMSRSARSRQPTDVHLGSDNFPQGPDSESAETYVATTALPDLKSELDRLHAEVAFLTDLGDRIIGVLAAGRSLTFKELQSRLAIPDGERGQIAGLQACLGKLLTSGVVVNNFSYRTPDSYTLSKDWRERHSVIRRG